MLVVDHAVLTVLAEELHSKLEDPQLGRKKGALLFLEFAEYPLEKAFKMTSFEGSKKPPSDRMDGCTSLEDGTVFRFAAYLRDLAAGGQQENEQLKQQMQTHLQQMERKLLATGVHYHQRTAHA